MKELLESAASRLEIDTDTLVEGGLVRGRVRRRHRRLLTGLGTAAAAGVVATGVVLPVLHDEPVAVDGGFAARPTASPTAAPSVPPAREVPKPAGTRPGVENDHEVYVGGTDAPLTLDVDGVLAAMAALLPAGEIGPVLDDGDYSPVVTDQRRVVIFTYEGTETYVAIMPAAGEETCASMAAASGDTCEQVNGHDVLVTDTDAAGGFAGWVSRTATVWNHGYQVSVSSSNATPTSSGTRPTFVGADAPLTIDDLVTAASSEVFFQ